MRMTHEELNKELEWNENEHLAEFIIESPIFFRSIIRDLGKIDEGGKIHFTQGGKAIASKDIEIVFNPLNLDFNNRRVITTLLKMVLKTSLSEDFYLPTNNLKTNIIKYLSEIVDSREFNFEVETDEFTIESIAKATNLHVVGDEDDFVELITDYMAMMTELIETKLFIFINLRSFMNEDETKRLVKNILNHQFNVLLIENQNREKIENGSRIIIDKDLCEL